jgi:2-keto-4-pentenoate hydratase/2-oxohepta-3-ene-1,7-dioic acid hydratase in catechol pathway
VRWVRYQDGPSVRWGVVKDGRVTPHGGDPLSGAGPSGPSAVLEESRLLAPCVPGKVIGVAINYKGATGLSEGMKEPLIFLKSPGRALGPGAAIRCPFRDVNVWGESELAIVVGRRLSRASPAEARAGILGYTVGNDVSADNVQGWDHHLARSKAADDFCALGPWIDTGFDPAGKSVEGFHNGALLRKGSADDRLWKDAEILSFLSGWMTLEPWDVVLTGAPSRVRDRVYFQEGDTFTCTIEGLGSLTNKFTYK